MELSLDGFQSHFNGDQWCRFDAFNLKENVATIEVYISQDLSWFKGHFPQQPVLPGVVQTHWACELAQYCFNLEGIKKVSNLKFKSMVLPETAMNLTLNFNSEKNTVSFHFHDSEESFSIGSLHFTQSKNYS